MTAARIGISYEELMKIVTPLEDIYVICDKLTGVDDACSTTEWCRRTSGKGTSPACWSAGPCVPFGRWA